MSQAQLPHHCREGELRPTLAVLSAKLAGASLRGEVLLPLPDQTPGFILCLADCPPLSPASPIWLPSSKELRDHDHLYWGPPTWSRRELGTGAKHGAARHHPIHRKQGQAEPN